MNFIQNILPDSIIYSVGIMLIHMLWQGIAAAILLGFVLLLLRNSSPQSRYSVSVFTMALLPVMAMVTFFVQLNRYNYLKEIEGIMTTEHVTLVGEHLGIIDSFKALYIDYLPLIVLIWILGMSALLLKSMGNLIIIQRLKHFYFEEVSENIQEVINRISEKFRIRRNILTRISTKVSVPMVIGHFKPVLLLPKTILEKLSESELFAVLHHELAHIKRNDYLVNIFQTAIEILFFFHPATWWISAIIRREREECCDTCAIEKEQDRLTLAKALTSIQENRLNAETSMVMSAIGKSSLIKRIKNMFRNRPVLPSFKEGIIVALFFVAAFGLMSFMVDGNILRHPDSTETLSNKVSGELVDGRHLFARTDESGNITDLFVEGKKVNKRKFGNYQMQIDSMLLANEESKKKEELNKELEDLKQIDKEQELEIAQEELQKTLENIKIDFSEEEREKLKKDLGTAGSTLSEILPEVLQTVSEELEKGLGKNFKFNMDINDGGDKVYMKADGNKFVMDINDGEDKVVMRADENGFYLNVEEDGKNTVNMRIDSNGMSIKADED